MTEPRPTVTEELRATLWRRVGDATRINVEELDGVLERLAAAPLDAHLLDRGIKLAHSIAGSAGVYGFRDEARAASSIEGLLRTRTGDGDGGGDIAPARAALGVLRDGFADPA